MAIKKRSTSDQLKDSKIDGFKIEFHEGHYYGNIVLRLEFKTILMGRNAFLWDLIFGEIFKWNGIFIFICNKSKAILTF